MASPAEFLKELRRHLGYSEPANGVTPYGVWYSRRVGDAQFRDDPWCAMFVSYCGDKTNAPVGQFAWTVAQAKWFKQRGRFDRKPRRGSLVFFDWGGSHDLDRIDHVGVVEQVRKDGTLVTLEGNTSDRVARRVRTMSTVVGFGHPEWEKKPVKHERKWRVVATTRFGGVRIIYRLNGGGYSWNPKKGSRAVLTAHQVTEAKKWAKRHAAKTVRTVPLDGWTHLRLDPSTRWPTDQALLRRLNRVGRRLNRIVYIKSGHRNLSEQWGFWNHYQRYGSPVAAYPNANAPHIRGVAADCGIIDRRGNYSSLGLNPKARRLAERFGLAAWVGGEPWHIQRRETY